MYCPHCGTRLQDGARFCTTCGANLSGESPDATRDDATRGDPPRNDVRPEVQPDGTAPAIQSAADEPRRRRLPVAAIAGACMFAIGVVLALVVAPLVSRPKNSWTVMAYVCGSDLESDKGLATANFEELLTVDLPDDVAFLVEAGGSKTWHSDLVDPTQLTRCMVGDGSLEVQERLPLASMGDPQTLADFVRWGAESHPAEHYALVIWDHGGGSLTGVCLDELHGDGLTLPEIDQALAQAGVHLDVAGFDTCLMATLENAQMLSRHADYLVGSEEVEPNEGWAWAEWPTWFATSDPDDVAGLCTGIVDTYLQRCAREGTEDTATLSVVDLSQVDEVALAFEQVSEAMARGTERAGLMQRLIIQGNQVEHYGYANYLKGHTNMVDLGDLAARVGDALDEDVSAMEDALGRAVVYERHGKSHDRSTGLSVFYPIAVDTGMFADYRTLSRTLSLGNDAYQQYLAARTGVYDRLSWDGAGIEGLDPVQASDAQGAFSYAGEIGADGSFRVRVTGNTEFLQVATYQFGQVQPDGSVVPLGSGNDLDLQIDERGQVTYTDQFKGGVLNVGGAYAYAQIVDMVSEDGHPSYNLYSSPVEITRATDLGTATARTNLLVMYDYASHGYDVVCYYDDVDESGMAEKSIATLQEGDRIKFLVAREVAGQVQTGSTGTIAWQADTKVEELNPGDATYVYQIVLRDIFGQEYAPVSARITFKDGKRTAELIG